MRELKIALMLPVLHKYLVLKHKTKCDFILKFKDVPGPKLCYHSSALSRPLVGQSGPAKSVARRCQGECPSTALAGKGLEICRR